MNQTETGPDQPVSHPQAILPGVSPADAGARRPRLTVLLIAALLLAGVAAYSGSFRGAFVFDDIPVMEQPAAQNLWPLGRILAAPRPVVQFTLALNHRFAGELWGYHAFNLAVHLLAALTLFGIVRRTLRLPMLAPRFGQAATALAFCIALLWMLHPLQTESVTYIVQRMESLMGLFYLLTLYCFIRAAETNQSAIGNWQLPIGNWYVGAVVACALGMGSKEVMVTAPVLVLLYDRTFIAGSFRAALRRRWGFYLALAATWLLLSRQILEAAAPQGKSAGFGLPGMSPFQYALSELGVILHYLALTFWPSGLCLDYGWPAATRAWDILSGAIFVGGLLALTIRALIRKPAPPPSGMAAWGFLGAWFFLVLAPTSSVLPIADLAFEHRMYLPVAAVVTATVLAGYAVLRVQSCRGLTVALVAMLAVALGGRTFVRNLDYRSGLSIWQAAAEERPRNPRAWYYLGQIYSSMGRPQLALFYCTRAIEIAPRWAAAYDNRGTVYVQLRRYDEAIADYDQAIRYDPNSAAAWYNRGKAKAATGRFAAAIQDYDEALLRDPGFADAWYNRGNACVRLDPPDYDQAIIAYGNALRLRPDYTLALHNRGITWAAKGRYDLAIRDYDSVLESHPDYPEALFHRGDAYSRLGSYALALADCDRAIALKPDLTPAYAARANILYRLKDFRKALADATTFIQAGGKLSPEFLKALTDAATSAPPATPATPTPPPR